MACITAVLGTCTLAAYLTAVDIYDSNMGTTAMSYDGVERDVSQFYEDEQTNFYISGVIQTEDRAIQFGYDNGIDTAKFDQNPTYQLSVTEVITDKLSVSLGGSYGGATKHTPCVDQYDRQYYCGNLTAFQGDYDEKANHSFNIGIRYNF